MRRPALFWLLIAAVAFADPFVIKAAFPGLATVDLAFASLCLSLSINLILFMALPRRSDRPRATGMLPPGPPPPPGLPASLIAEMEHDVLDTPVTEWIAQAEEAAEAHRSMPPQPIAVIGGLSSAEAAGLAEAARQTARPRPLILGPGVTYTPLPTLPDPARVPARAVECPHRVLDRRLGDVHERCVMCGAAIREAGSP